MTDPRDHDRLPEDAARRLIERASELDLVLAKESSVGNLRAAAREAGISEEAFQRALDEVRAASVASPATQEPQKMTGRRQWIPVAIVALVAGVALLFFARVRPHQSHAVPAAEAPAAPAFQYEPKAAPKPGPRPKKVAPTPATDPAIAKKAPPTT